jgi:ribosomal protein S18 acetylase RimI-like enzyme
MLSTICSLCGAKAQFRDRRSGQDLCLEHARLEVVATGQRPATPALTIRPAKPVDYGRIEELALHFWDETEVDCFDREYDVLGCPAFLACDGKQVVGVASYALEVGWNAIVLVILNLLPGYQGRGGGRALLDAVRDEGQRRGLGCVLVVTSNDDLPALALYQRYGFRITEVLPGRIAEHHGGEIPGFAGIPVRDEIRLEYRL